MEAVAPNYKTLFDAVERNDKTTVKRLISEGLPATTADHKGETAAHIAAKKGNIAILEYLLSEDKSLISVKDKVGQNVLHVAAAKGATDIVKYLVDNCNVDVFHKDNIRNDNSVVHVAAREGHLDLVKYFIEEKKFDVNVLNENGESPAFVAAGNKQLPIVTYLVEKHGADLQMVDYENRNILFPAAMSGDVTIPTYVLDQKKVRLDINWADKGFRTVLHWSALGNFLRISTYFVDVKRAEVNAPDLMKQTPLHLAAQAGHLKLVEYLYENGADPELPDAYGKTPVDVTKDKKIKQFFQDYPKQRRHRRSASQFAQPIPAHRYSNLANQPAPYSWAPGISADLFRSRHYLAEGRTNQHVVMSYPDFNNFLVLANVFVRSKRSLSGDRPLLSSSGAEPPTADIVRNLDNDFYEAGVEKKF